HIPHQGDRPPEHGGAFGEQLAGRLRTIYRGAVEIADGGTGFSVVRGNDSAAHRTRVQRAIADGGLQAAATAALAFDVGAGRKVRNPTRPVVRGLHATGQVYTNSPHITSMDVLAVTVLVRLFRRLGRILLSAGQQELRRGHRYVLGRHRD